jgi:hypothetical protein
MIFIYLFYPEFLIEPKKNEKRKKNKIFLKKRMLARFVGKIRPLFERYVTFEKVEDICIKGAIGGAASGAVAGYNYDRDLFMKDENGIGKYAAIRAGSTLAGGFYGAAIGFVFFPMSPVIALAGIDYYWNKK